MGHHPYFFAGRERELRDQSPRRPSAHTARPRDAARRGMDPDLVHPDDGQPDELVIARCTGCPARLACLALALRAEEPDARAGWYVESAPRTGVKSPRASTLTPRNRTCQKELPERRNAKPPAGRSGETATRWDVPQDCAAVPSDDRSVNKPVFRL